MAIKETTSIELRAKSKVRMFRTARKIAGAVLIVAGFTSAIGAIIGVASAAMAADGGNSNGGFAFMLMGMCMAAVMGLLPTVLWMFEGAAKNRSRAYSSFGVAGLSLIGCALGHCFGGAFWSAWCLDWVVGGATVATAVTTLFAYLIAAREEATMALCK